MSVYGRKSPFKNGKMMKFFKSLHYSDELMIGVGIDSRSQFSFGDEFVAYHRFGDTLAVGLGIGLQGCSKLDNEHYFHQTDEASRTYSMALFMPIFIRATVSPFRFGDWKPFARCDVGGAIRLSHGQGGGFAFAPALGTDFKVNKLNLFFALSYQWMQTAYTYDEYLGQPAQEVSSSASALMLHAGINF